MYFNMSLHKNRNFGDVCIDLDWTLTKTNETIVCLKTRSLEIGSILPLHMHISAQMFTESP